MLKTFCYIVIVMNLFNGLISMFRGNVLWTLISMSVAGFLFWQVQTYPRFKE